MLVKYTVFVKIQVTDVLGFSGVWVNLRLRMRSFDNAFAD